jgi:hypothetical protein
MASPTFTGTVSGIDKAMVGLSNVDDTMMLIGFKRDTNSIRLKRQLLV